jgi:hypothetical protein
MRLVLTTVFGPDDADIADDNVRFHLNAGVDLVLAASVDDRVGEALRSFGDRVKLERGAAEHGSGLRTRLARQAATEHGADWVISSDAREFWWPRGEDLKEVLAPIPERYTIVQGLRRDFVAAPGEGASPERATMRPSLEHAPPSGSAMVLRPVFRADPQVELGGDGAVHLRRNVPLRAWYPIEVLHFPHDGRPRDDSELVEDVRLRDALQSLVAGESPLRFRVPDIVEDARYAVECAAVGEVDLPRLEQYVTELEQRIEWLEQRFWPRVLRRVARIAGRSS